MSSNVEGMIDRLTPAIEQKCEELRAARKQRVQSRIFVLLCAMVVLVPALLVLNTERCRTRTAATGDSQYIRFRAVQ